ncbi:hypothetical protein Kpho02_44200 [Kitasatospora phosalacinea]|uniref:Uncharacterized protein n=1 Tax=Kitasatospora phosalacinea TaxID=2065 RepID=A0A9W6V1Y4_9ACTN|nr:hypothetical protein Kpho02_44200 [Kitasatospora phosalacinea]
MQGEEPAAGAHVLLQGPAPGVVQHLAAGGGEHDGRAARPDGPPQYGRVLGVRDGETLGGPQVVEGGDGGRDRGVAVVGGAGEDRHQGRGGHGAPRGKRLPRPCVPVRRTAQGEGTA